VTRATQRTRSLIKERMVNDSWGDLRIWGEQCPVQWIVGGWGRAQVLNSENHKAGLVGPAS